MFNLLSRMIFGAFSVTSIVLDFISVLNGTTAYVYGDVNMSRESMLRINDTFIYPVPSKSAGSLIFWTEDVWSALNHLYAYTLSLSIVIRP